MKSFLGLVGWYDIYIEHYASLAAPLTDAITKKRAPGKRITWTPGMREAFDTLKRKLLDNVVVKIVDTSRGLTIRTDSSGWAVGGVLEQEPPGGGLPRPIAFFSKKLTGDYELRTGQCGWHTREQETYALVC